MIDIILNLVIFAVTAILMIRFSRKNGRWTTEQIRVALRFFTCQSNVLCAVSAVVMAAALLSGNIPEWVWILKYIGTAGVTVTMVTVFLILAPKVGKGWANRLLTGPDFFMHLLTPILAIVTFCVFEKRGMVFPQCLWGLLPIVLYGPLYLYKVLRAPEGKGWNDFYGFNTNGKWPVYLAVMLTGTFLICLGFMALQNG